MNKIDTGNDGIDLSRVEEGDFEIVEHLKNDSAKAEEAFQEQEKILQVYSEVNNRLLKLAKMLIPFRDDKMWFYLGCSSFQEWYQGLGLSKTTVYRSMAFYEVLVLDYGISEDVVFSKDVRKLDKILPLKNVKSESGKPVLNKDTAEEWIYKSSEMSEPDLIKEINEAKGIKSESDRLEEEEGLVKGTYVLLKTSEKLDDLRILSDKKVPVELYKNGDDNFVVRVL